MVSLIAFMLANKEGIKKRQGDEQKPFLANKKRALAYYNVLSSVYDVLNPHLYTFLIREEIIKLLNSETGLRVLDVGCGTGYTTRGILQLLNPSEVVGVDQNYKQLMKATKNLCFEKTKISLTRGEVENLPFSGETFDAVVSVGAVEYFPDLDKALREITRVTKHGGKVVVGGPAFDWFKKVSLHRIFYTPEAQHFEKEFYRVGLESVTTKLMGVNTFFGTDHYVLVGVGTRK